MRDGPRAQARAGIESAKQANARDCEAAGVTAAATLAQARQDADQLRAAAEVEGKRIRDEAEASVAQQRSLIEDSRKTLADLSERA